MEHVIAIYKANPDITITVRGTGNGFETTVDGFGRTTRAHAARKQVSVAYAIKDHAEGWEVLRNAVRYVPGL